MRPVLSRAQIRAFDEYWIKRGVPGIVLMENAGRGAAHLIGLKARPRASGDAPRSTSSVVGSCIRCADERSLASVDFLILAGPGNNGGDGYVVARHLASRGASVRVVSLLGAEQLRGDARTAHQAMRALGLFDEPLPEESAFPELFRGVRIVVDALLGTGADRQIEGKLSALIEALNASGASVIALDVPSGLDADTGAALGPVVQAMHTVTFAHLKRGLLTTSGHRFASNITVSHIGVPSELPSGVVPAAFLLEEADVRSRLTQRSPVTHKGSAGRVVLVAGSPGTVGAARISARASLRAGAGLVTICTDPVTAHQLQEEVVEVMTHGMSLTAEGERSAQGWLLPSAGTGEPERALFAQAGALVVGPGLGRGGRAEQALSLAWQAGRPLVVDADGLRALGALTREGLKFARPDSGTSLALLTPHPGEAADLLETTILDVEADRFLAAQRIAERFFSTVILKGSRTIIASPGEIPVVSAFGTPALATAGSGDVLSGICGALLAQASSAKDVFELAQLGVALQGMAAESWSRAHGDRGLLASEIADLVPSVIQYLLAPSPS